jgi:hypothetical protein
MGADRRASLKADDPLGKGIHDIGKLQGFLSSVDDINMTYYTIGKRGSTRHH